MRFFLALICGLATAGGMLATSDWYIRYKHGSDALYSFNSYDYGTAGFFGIMLFLVLFFGLKKEGAEPTREPGADLPSMADEIVPPER